MVRAALIRRDEGDVAHGLHRDWETRPGDCGCGGFPGAAEDGDAGAAGTPGTDEEAPGRSGVGEQVQNLLVQSGYVLFDFGLHQDTAQDAPARHVGRYPVPAGGHAGPVHGVGGNEQ